MSDSDTPGGSTSISDDSQGICACQHGYRQDGPLICRNCELTIVLINIFIYILVSQSV